jgi:hypothetical protein
MICCVRALTDEDCDSLFEEGSIEPAQATRGDAVGQAVPAIETSFQQTNSGGAHEWHQDPESRFVITLSGTLKFDTKSGATFTMRSGDVLLAQDNSGSGHKWRLIRDERTSLTGKEPTSSYPSTSCRPR